MYKNSHELIELLKKHGLYTQKKLGQNFLIDRGVLEKIVAAAELSKTDNVVEVGPGLGILTEQLAQTAAAVTSLELDARLIPILKEQLSSYPNLQIILADALKFPLPTTPYKLVANIPYYITSPLLNHFLQSTERSEVVAPPLQQWTNVSTPSPSTKPKRPSLIVLLVQKEVAEKICAPAGDHTILSLQVQIFGKPQIVSYVKNTSFFPAPQVDSAIIKIQTYDQPLIQNIDTFFHLIKATFSQRRKTLSNSLKNSYLHIPAEQTENLLKSANINPIRRPQELTIEEWEKLTDEYLKYSYS